MDLGDIYNHKQCKYNESITVSVRINKCIWYRLHEPNASDWNPTETMNLWSWSTMVWVIIYNNCIKPLAQPMVTWSMKSYVIHLKAFSAEMPTDLELISLVVYSSLWLRKNTHQLSTLQQPTFLITGLILGLRPANERRRYEIMPSHWLGANLESALIHALMCL